MKRFKNILVAVDLSRGDHFVSPDLAPPTVEAIERAIWLAKFNSARLTFFSALDVSPAAHRRIEEASGDNSVLVEANELVTGLVKRAVAANVEAEFCIHGSKQRSELSETHNGCATKVPTQQRLCEKVTHLMRYVRPH